MSEIILTGRKTKKGKNLNDHGMNSYCAIFFSYFFYRFSRDVETIDNNLPQNFRMFLNTFFGALSVFVVISYSTPLFLTIILPMAILYYLVQVGFFMCNL